MLLHTIIQLRGSSRRIKGEEKKRRKATSLPPPLRPGGETEMATPWIILVLGTPFSHENEADNAVICLDNAVIISRNRQYNNQMISTYLLREGDDAKLVFAMMYILSL